MPVVLTETLADLLVGLLETHSDRPVGSRQLEVQVQGFYVEALVVLL